MGFIRINNRENFLLDSVANIHPASMEYIRWWKSEKKKIIEGYWGPDDASIVTYDVHSNPKNIKTEQWRYMPPQLYFYVNFGTILHNPEGSPKTAPKKRMKPLLRDVEWEFSYYWFEARGFSGFSEDDEYSCNRDILRLQKGEEVLLDSSCYNSKKEIKHYVPARQYLRRLFKKPLGLPLYMNEARNLFMLGSRGFGKDLEENTLLHYIDGSLKPIKEVSIGDKIFGADGKPTIVTNRFDFNDQEQFEIKLKEKKEPVISGLGHIWRIKTIAGEFNRELRVFKSYPDHILLPYKNSLSDKLKWSQVEYIKSIGIRKSVCIAVDNKDKLFIVNDFIVTHNSYIVGSSVILHELVTDGAKVYTQDSIDNPSTVEVFVGAALSSKSSDILSKTVMSFNEMPGAWKRGTDEETPSPLYKEMAGSLEPNNMKNPWRHEYEKKVNGKWKKHGSLSRLLHGIYTIENPEAAAGTRPGVMVIEEVGLLPNLLTVHGSNTATQLEGTVKFGSSVYLGTGGNMEKIIESETIFRDPEGFDFLSFEDEWENKGKIGWFVPAYYALNQFKDKNGNTDIDAALGFLEKRRDRKRKSKSSSAITLELLSYPIVPSEMFLKHSGSIFPVDDLKYVLSDLETDDIMLDSSWKGRFTITKEGKVEFVNSSLPVIRNFPLKGGEQMDGCIEIYEMPKKSKTGQIISGRYIAGTDPVDDDGNANHLLSLQSSFILDTFTDRIVAEYTARTNIAEEYYETLRRLLLFYNAKTNYESQKKGLYGYFKNKKSLNLLSETPQILSDVDLVKIQSVGNKKFGTNANEKVNAWGRRLILRWLLDKATGGEEEVMNMHLIRSVALLKELIMWSSDINADRVSAMIMLMIYREEVIENIDKEDNPIPDISNDPFWDKSFRSYNSNKFGINTMTSSQNNFLNW